jgi:DNA anti-recombination protein RmuC
MTEEQRSKTMGKPISQINEDYDNFESHILSIVRLNWKEIWSSDLELERRFSNLEHDIKQVLTTVNNLDGNLRLYREDSRIFRTELKAEFDKFRTEIKTDNDKFRTEIKADLGKMEQANEKFRTEIKTDFDKFRQESNDKFDKMEQANEKFRQETNDKFDKIDQRFEKVDQRFDTINKQFIDVHKAITRMTVVFISGLGVIVLLAKLIDKLWP